MPCGSCGKSRAVASNSKVIKSVPKRQTYSGGITSPFGTPKIRLSFSARGR